MSACLELACGVYSAIAEHVRDGCLSIVILVEGADTLKRKAIALLKVKLGRACITYHGCGHIVCYTLLINYVNTVKVEALVITCAHSSDKAHFTELSVTVCKRRKAHARLEVIAVNVKSYVAPITEQRGNNSHYPACRLRLCKKSHLLMSRGKNNTECYRLYILYRDILRGEVELDARISAISRGSRL